MATPRQHWFRVNDEVLRLGWTDSQLATFVRLLAWLNQRWARDGKTAANAGTADLAPAALFEIAGKRRLDAARSVVRSLAGKIGMSVEDRGDITRIDWPNYAILQNLEARERGFPFLRGGRRRPPPHTQTPEKDASASSSSGASMREQIVTITAQEVARGRGLRVPDDQEGWDWLEMEARRLAESPEGRAMRYAELAEWLISKLASVTPQASQ